MDESVFSGSVISNDDSGINIKNTVISNDDSGINIKNTVNVQF